MGGGTLHPIPPPGVISDRNQSGLILILTGLSLSFVLLSFAIRVYIRHPKGLWKLDDHVLTVATVLSCIQSLVVFRAVHYGLGDVEYATSDVVRKYYFANNFLYILVLSASKASMGALYLRLTRDHAHLVVVWGLLATCAVWTVASLFLVGIAWPWQDTFTLPFWRWLVVGITDCLTDIGLVLMSVYMVKGLRLTFIQKSTVVAAFGTRLFALVPCVIRLCYLDPTVLSRNRNFAISLAIVCGQLELGYGLMAASVVVLKPFIGVYDKSDHPSSYAAPHTNSRPYYTAKVSATASNTANAKETFKMQSMRSNKSIRSVKDKLYGLSPIRNSFDQDDAIQPAAPAGLGLHNLTRKASMQSHDSRKMIIECKTEWSVKYEGEHTKHSGSTDRDMWDGPATVAAVR